VDEAPAREPRLVILGVCLAILGAAALLHPSEPNDPRVRLAGTPLPGLCMMRQLTGVPCPGCGLTRSIVSAVHGELRESFFHHRLGLAILFYVLLQAAHSLIWLASGWWRAHGTLWGRTLDRGLLAFPVLLAVNWVFTLVRMIASF